MFVGYFFGGSSGFGEGAWVAVADELDDGFEEVGVGFLDFFESGREV